MIKLDIFELFPLLSTPRLHLRAIGEGDALALFEIFSDDEVMKYWSRRPYASINQALDLIRKINDAYRDKTGIEWSITEKGSDRLVGKCGFHKLYKEHDRAEIGYTLARSRWGQGIISEALSAIINLGFERMNLHSIEAQIDPGNARSAKVLERQGFVKEGHLCENFMVEGKFSDTAIFSLLRSRWAS